MPFKFNALTGNFDLVNEEVAGTTVATKAVLLASSPAGPVTAFASDTSQFFVYDGAVWREASITLSAATSSVDAGYLQENDAQGYGETLIYDKDLLNVKLGTSDRNSFGSFRLDTSQDPPVVQVYYSGKWNELFVFDIKATDELELLFRNTLIDTWSGNGNDIGLNGVAITQQYSTVAGAYPAPLILDGGTVGGAT
jgi:hypothetical protein